MIDFIKFGLFGKDISKIYNDIVKDIRGVVKIVGNLEVGWNENNSRLLISYKFKYVFVGIEVNK